MLVTRLGSLVLLGAPLECTGVHRQREGNSSSCTIDVTRASERRAGGRAGLEREARVAGQPLGSARGDVSAARRSSGLEPKPVQDPARDPVWTWPGTWSGPGPGPGLDPKPILDPARDQVWTRPGTWSGPETSPGPGPGPGLDPARDQVCLLGRAEPAGASLGENSTPLLLVVVVFRTMGVVVFRTMGPPPGSSPNTSVMTTASSSVFTEE
ncbi:unnamed protein product [Boreogadus saida]